MAQLLTARLALRTIRVVLRALLLQQIHRTPQTKELQGIIHHQRTLRACHTTGQLPAALRQRNLPVTTSAW